MKKQRQLFILWLLLIAGLLAAPVVQAHAGGKMQIASADAGDFKLTIWTSPDPARTGEIHVAAAVASAETALPILDATVFVELEPQNAQVETLRQQATTEDSTNQFLYESIFEVPAEGLYQVSVMVDGTGGEKGDVTFDLLVEPAPPLILGIIALVILAGVTGGAVYLYLRWTAPQPEAVTAE
jgi:hypothetical protein